LGLRGNFVGTILGEEKNSTIFFSWVEGVEVASVAGAFCASFEHAMKRMHFAV
jgi:hypothetical protein